MEDKEFLTGGTIPVIANVKEALNSGTFSLSVIVPVFNEDAVIKIVAEELIHTLSRIAHCWEIVFIDDGSTDSTYECLKPFTIDYPVKILRLPERMGQSAALIAGFGVIHGHLVVTMDGDGQNDPKDIPKLLNMLRDFDLVIGNRRIRRDPLSKRWFSSCGNFVRNKLTGSKLPDSGCAIKAFRRETLRMILPVDGIHRFIPAIVEINGGRVVSIDVSHRSRNGGRSKYGILDRLLLPLIDCLALAWLRKRRLPNTILNFKSGLYIERGSNINCEEKVTNTIRIETDFKVFADQRIANQ